MNKRIKLNIAIVSLGLLALVSSLNAYARPRVKGCFGKDNTVCFTEGNREYYGQWREVMMMVNPD